MLVRYRPSYLLLLILLLAFFLRVHDLDAQPLRGDEAFAVRYWAAPPADILSGLAWIEPHPFGTYFSFWAWKSLAGESEFAMRLLPAMVNTLGAAAMYALARRVGKPARPNGIALLAAFLWAINPNLIWHSQDVRNYAPWAGLSVTALWLLLRALDKRRPRAWALYVAIETITLYVFFLEAFMLVVHGIWVLSTRYSVLSTRLSPLSTEHQVPRTQNPLLPFLSIGVLLIPWLYQAYRLAGSGYGGTAARSDLAVLLNDFVPELLFGERTLSSLGGALPGWGITGVFLAFVLLWWLVMPRSRAAALSLLMIVIPSALLYVAGTRLDVFRPRYIIAITPALILPLASVAGLLRVAISAGMRQPARGWRSPSDNRIAVSRILYPELRVRRFFQPTTIVLGWLLLMVTLFVSLDALATFYGSDYRKGADWRTLGEYLEIHVGAGDVLIMRAADPSGSLDPTFQYYYGGAFQVLPRAGVNIDAEIARLIAAYYAIVLVDQSTGDQTVRLALDAQAVWQSDAQAADFRVSVFRPG